MKHYKSHIALFSFSRRFCTRPYEASGVPPPSSRESLPAGWPERQGSPPAPGDEAALDKHRTYQRERVRHTIVNQFSSRRAPMSLGDDLELSDGPGASLEAGTPARGSSIRTRGRSPDAPPSTGNWRSCPADPRRLRPGREPPPAQYKVPPRQWDSESFCPLARQFSSNAEARTPAFVSG